MPLFLEQHGTVDEETGETIECYAEHCGNIQLYDQSAPGSSKPRTMTVKEDFWKAGWETDDAGDSVDAVDVDEETVEKFKIDPYKTTKQDLAQQFGKRFMYISATWGQGAPEGKSGLMKGTPHSFFTGGDVVKKRGLPVEEKPKKKPAPAAANSDGSEEEEETEEEKEAREKLEESEARVTELEEQMEKLRTEMKEAIATATAPKPQESMASQFEGMARAVGAVGNMNGANVSAQASAQREQFWQEQIAAARKEVSDRERFWNEEVARVRSTVHNETSAKVLSYETRLQTLFSELSAARTTAGTEAAAIHQAQRDELARREVAHDNAIAAIKEKLTRAEVQLSDFRQSSDGKVSELNALLSHHKLLEMQAGVYKNFETEKTARIEKEFGEIKAERDHLKTLNAEQNETIETMRRNLHTPTHTGDGEGSGSFTIPRGVWKVLLPALPMIGMLLWKFFADSGKPMPKEAADWFAKQAEKAGVPGADAWAQQNYADAAEQERARKEKEWDDNERERLRREEAERVERAARATEAAREERAKAEAEREKADADRAKTEEAARVERIANERREAEKAAAALVEKQAEAARVEAARIEAAKVEAAKAEAAKAEAARIEVARVETARTEAAKIETARIEGERTAAALRIADAERTAPARAAGTPENPINTPPPSAVSNATE